MTSTSPQPTPPLNIRRPFTRAAALAAGMELKRLRSDEFRVLVRGVYVAAAVPWTPALRAVAAVLPFHETSWASHASAARILGVPTPTLPDEHVTVVEPRHRRTREDIVCHLAVQGQTQVVNGTRASSYPQLFVELAELVPLVELVVAGDHMVRRCGVRPEDLVAFAESSSLPGAELARRAAGYVRERVDSPMETRSRMLLVLAGLPEPTINPTIRTADGEPLRRYDLHYEASNTIVEYDGRQHIEREQQWERDLERREDITDEGARIIVVTSSGIYRHPGRTVERVWRVLRERGELGVPKRLSDAWRPHFPERE